MKNTSKWSLSIILTILIAGLSISSCRKKIKAPTESATQIFGKWEWVYSQSEFGGVTQIPENEGLKRELEYTERGQFKELIDGKKEEKLLFSFIEGTTIDFAAPE